MRRISKIGGQLWAHRLVSGGITAASLVAVVSSLLLFGRGNSAADASQQRATHVGGSVTYQLTPNSATPSPSDGSGSTDRATSTPGSGIPSATPTSHTSNPGDGTPSDIGATPATTPSSGIPSPSATPTSLPSTPGPTPTPTSGPYDDAIAIAPTTLTTAPWSASPTLYLTVKNTGTTTWGADQNVNYYYLACYSGCPAGTYAFGLGPDSVIAPGQSYRFGLSWMLDTFAWTRITRQTHWRMVHGTGIPMTRTPFGADMVLTVTETGEAPLLHQAAPSCANPAGVTWASTNTTGNTVACAGNSLLMQQQAGKAPLLVPSVSVAGYDPNNNHVHIHLHFGSASTTTFAGFAVNTSAPDGCGGERFWVRPDGTWQQYEYVKYYGQTTCTQQLGQHGTVSAGTDFDLLYVYQQAANQFFFVNGTLLWDGGNIGPYGMPGLTVQDSSGSSAPVYFSQFEVDAPVATTVSYQLAS